MGFCYQYDEPNARNHTMARGSALMSVSGGIATDFGSVSVPMASFMVEVAQSAPKSCWLERKQTLQVHCNCSALRTWLSFLSEDGRVNARLTNISGETSIRNLFMYKTLISYNPSLSTPILHGITHLFPTGEYFAVIVKVSFLWSACVANLHLCGAHDTVLDINDTVL
jgi:hypothetical protein